MFVEAGLEQAASWRTHESGPYFHHGVIPDVMFPRDRAWVLSTLWDDTWRCLGGPTDLIDTVVAEPRLKAREVKLGEDATPPGHQSR